MGADPPQRFKRPATPGQDLTVALLQWGMFIWVMAETVEELTIHYEEDGQVLRKQLEKEVLSKGSWTTIMFLYQDLDRKSGEYGHHKVSIRRYQKREGAYVQRSKFEISSPKQALAIRDRIEIWFPEEPE